MTRRGGRVAAATLEKFRTPIHNVPGASQKTTAPTQTTLEESRMTNKWAVVVGLVAFALAAPSAHAEVSELRLATQFGIGAMPMILMQRNHLLERELEKAGLPNVNIQWRQFPGGNPMNEGLLSGSLDIVSGGTT